MAKPARKPHPSTPPCPSCGSSLAVVRIAYGLPGPGLIEQADRGEFVLGGCVLEEDSPRWYCQECETGFGRIHDAA